jgi:hypothetical protein
MTWTIGCSCWWGMNAMRTQLTEVLNRRIPILQYHLYSTEMTILFLFRALWNFVGMRLAPEAGWALDAWISIVSESFAS